MSEVTTRKETAAAPINQDDQLLAIIMQAASNPDCDVDKLRALLDMKKEVMGMGDVKEFSEAMSAASGEIPQVEKNGTVSLGGKGGYRFTRWEDMDRVIRPILAKYNLRLSFDTRPGQNGHKIIVGTISHRNGQKQSAEIELPIDAGQGRNPLQGFGSTISYGKRYCAEMLLNIVRTDEDNDARTVQVPVITPEQKDILVDLIQRTNMDTRKFLAWVGCRSLDEMRSDAYPRARNALNKKLNEAVTA